MRYLPGLLLACGLGAAEPRLVLIPNASSAPVGTPIVVRILVAEAPAFACYGASLVMPSGNLGIAAQAAGEAPATPVWVKDSRTHQTASVRFGGYAAPPQATDRPAGTWELGRITLQASAAGTYVVKAPAFSTAEPFGGLVLPLASTQRVVLQAAELTLTITAGPAPQRVVTLFRPPEHEWEVLAPPEAVAGPETEDPQWFRLAPSQTSQFRLIQVPAGTR